MGIHLCGKLMMANYGIRVVTHAEKDSEDKISIKVDGKLAVATPFEHKL